MALPQVFLQDSKKSIEGAHWDAQNYWNSYASLWNSTFITTLMNSAYPICFKTSSGKTKRKKESHFLKIDRHSCRCRCRFLILESCNAYEYLRAIAAIILVVGVERSTAAARFWGRLELLKKGETRMSTGFRHIIFVIIKIIIINENVQLCFCGFSIIYIYTGPLTY